MRHFNNKARQAGMTLIELTVVLLVLIGLAGLMIPYVSGFISRTHDSTGTNNLAALNNNIQRFQGEFMSLPDDMHTLVENSTNQIYGDLMNTSMLTVATYTSNASAGVQSTEAPLFSMRRAGMTKFVDMKDHLTNASKTFDAGNTSFPAPNPMMPAAGTLRLAKATKGDNTTIENHLADAFGLQQTEFNAGCNDYIVLGIGQESQLIGRTMSDAPIHFAQNGDMGPNNKYNRFVAVFEVDKADGSTAITDADARDNGSTIDCGVTTQGAKFIGTAMIMMDGHLRGLAHEMNHTYTNIAAQ